MNDIIKDIESSIYLFAGDTSILKSIDAHNIDGTFQSINNDLQRLHEWSRQWRMNFNASKTNYVIFSMRKNKINYPNLYLGNTQIKKVQHVKHLGMILNSDLKWNNHIDDISNKVKKRVDSMRRLRFVLPRSTLCNLYKTVVRPILEYGSVLLGNLSVYNKDRLENIQKEVSQICTCAIRRTNYQTMLDDLGWETLDTRRKFQRLCLLYKIKNGIVPTYLQDLIPIRMRNIQYNLTLFLLLSP